MKTSLTGKSGRLGRGVLDSRRERLAAALRANLRKRKCQARVRERSNPHPVEANLRPDDISE
jgi:hypothetical protein